MPWWALFWSGGWRTGEASASRLREALHKYSEKPNTSMAWSTLKKNMSMKKLMAMQKQNTNTNTKKKITNTKNMKARKKIMKARKKIMKARKKIMTTRKKSMITAKKLMLIQRKNTTTVTALEPPIGALM